MSALTSAGFAMPKFGVRIVGKTAGLSLGLLGVLGVVLNRQVCLWEAQLSAGILGLTGLVDDPQRVGAAVIFADGDTYGGFLLTPGCSVAMLLSPFLVLGGFLLWIGRGKPRAIRFALGLLMLVFILTNQLRLTFVAQAMEWWGFQRGYEISHVSVGSVISAIGFVLGLLIFMLVLSRADTSRYVPRHRGRRRAAGSRRASKPLRSVRRA